jgi:predicted nucleic acid-binding protein
VLRAVLDANVYVSAAIRPEGPPGRIIERFLREATFQIVLSSAIAEEVLRALAYPKVRKVIRGHLEPELWFEDLLVLAFLG